MTFGGRTDEMLHVLRLGDVGAERGRLTARGVNLSFESVEPLDSACGEDQPCAASC